MRFRTSLWNNDDPLYGPCTNWTRDVLWWKVPPVYRDLGYPGGHVKLPGTRGDGLDAQRAAVARQLTRAMLEYYGHGPETGRDSWAWLIARYRNDSYSPFREVKANTASGYNQQLDKWQRAIGTHQIGAMTYEAARGVQITLRDKGRSDAYIKRLFTMLRTVAKYGAALRHKPSIEASAVLSSLRLTTPAKRMVAPTRAQVLEMVAAADERGLYDFSFGLLLQWHLALRSVDVRGQWFPVSEKDAQNGGVVRRSIVKRNRTVKINWSRWQDGLTWDMIEPDLSAITKVISKTERSMPEPTRFSLVDLPDLQARLRLLANGGRVGPVILSGDGMPYTRSGWAHAWARLRTELSLPKNMMAMDLRAGAITEAGDLGADALALRDMATHSDMKTTSRYLRGADKSIAKVIRLRNEG